MTASKVLLPWPKSSMLKLISLTMVHNYYIFLFGTSYLKNMWHKISSSLSLSLSVSLSLSPSLSLSVSLSLSPSLSFFLSLFLFVSCSVSSPPPSALPRLFSSFTITYPDHSFSYPFLTLFTIIKFIPTGRLVGRCVSWRKFLSVGLRPRLHAWHSHRQSHSKWYFHHYQINERYE